MSHYENEIAKIVQDALAKTPLTPAYSPAIPIQSYYPGKSPRKHATRPCPKLLDGSCPLLNGRLTCQKKQMRGCAFKVLGGGRQIDWARAGRLLEHPQVQLANWKHYASHHPKGVKCFNDLGIPDDPIVASTLYG